MELPIRSLHHVTATVSGAQEDVDFYARLLGMRLVKKTVNFDNHNVYHFYYGDDRGSPSTIMTTFPYRDWGVPIGTKGAGQITVTSFSVPAASLGFWRKRLTENRVSWRDEQTAFGEEALTFADPSGLELRLVAASRDAREPWVAEGIDAAAAIRGLHSVSLVVRDPKRTLELLTDVLGFDVTNEAERASRVAISGDDPGKLLEIIEAPDAPAAVNGIGTVHHVAMAIRDADEQLRIRTELLRLGYKVTEVRDRQYFQSIYFREPGGVLYEIATVQPGFTVDEELSRLGHDLKLPPWEEPHRSSIEQNLPPVDTP
jgi:glyoxalase family protein